jgi:hypothetical protein
MIDQVFHSLTVAFGTPGRGDPIPGFVILNTAHETGDLRTDRQFVMGKWTCHFMARIVECAGSGFPQVHFF